MGRRATATEVERVLAGVLLGREIHGVSVCDAWTLDLTDGWSLDAQEVVHRHGPRWERVLREGAPEVLEGIDGDAVACMGVLRVKRRAITRVAVEPRGALTLEFEGGGDLTFRVDLDVVDWCWRLYRPREGLPSGPYTDDLVACYFADELFLHREFATTDGQERG